MNKSRLSTAVEHIFAHYRDRYDTKLKEGKQPLSKNEVAGIIAMALDLNSSTSEEK